MGAMTDFEFVVVGQGLAGTALAWQLRGAGRRVLVVERGDAATASRVSAGLVTPITGRRLVKTWRLDDDYPAAVAFYRKVEAQTGAAFFDTRNMVRLFADEPERAAFELRPERALVSAPDPPVNDGWFAAPHGGFEMASAARLDVPRYLDASRAWFAHDGGSTLADIDPARDLETTDDGVRLPRLGVFARCVVFCQGFAARDNPWCAAVRFAPAKGEVLTVRVPGVVEARVVHRGVWLAPAGGDLYRAGSTYDRADLTPAPTAAGREQIVARLRLLLRVPFEIVGNAAAVRPIVEGGRPVFGTHPGRPRIGYFNGLGSKGVLHAPADAARFAARLAGMLDSR